MRQKALAAAVGVVPFLHHNALDAPHGLFFGNARVGHAIQMALEQFHFFGRRELPVIGNALVMIVRYEVVDVFFEVRARAADSVHFVLPDHFRERYPQLGGAHRARERNQHLPARGQMAGVSFRRVHHRGRVEVTEMLLQKRCYGTCHGRFGQIHFSSKPSFENENTRR